MLLWLVQTDKPLCQMQISIFAYFAEMKARGWSYKPCHANITFTKKVSVLHKLNFHPCRRIFLKARCRLLLLRCLWQFGWKTQSISWMTLTQISTLRSCTSPRLWQLPACCSRLQASSFKTLSAMADELHLLRKASWNNHKEIKHI